MRCDSNAECTTLQEMMPLGKGAPEEAEAMYDEILALIYKHVR